MKPGLSHLLTRWALITASLSTLLFLVAGTTQSPSIRNYLAVFSALLLVTMLFVTPELADERVRSESTGIDDGLRLAAGFFFLLTLAIATFSVGHLRFGFSVPNPLRRVALLVFALSGSLQTWAMIANPFFSPVVRLQSERGHRVIESGPYKYLRHPGYFAMLISIPASALAIGSWLGLVPAVAFALVIARRTGIEDEFLSCNLPGYADYANHVPGRLFPIKKPKKDLYVKHSA